MNRRQSCLVVVGSATAAFVLSQAGRSDWQASPWRALPPLFICTMWLVLALRRRAYPQVNLASWGIAASATLIGASPYHTEATSRGVVIGLGGAAVFSLGWHLARRQRAAAGEDISRVSAPRLWVALLVLGAAGALGSVLKFRAGGIPLLSGTVDVSRASARESASLIVGVLNECWIVGAWLCGAALLRVPGFPGGRHRFLPAWLFFMFGAALGGSRNAMATAVAVPALAAFDFSPARRQRLRRTIALAAAGLSVALVLFAFAGQRVVNGSGRFETDFRAKSGTSLVAAGVGMAEVSLTAPFETLGRVAATDLEIERGWGRYSTFSFSSIYGPLVSGRSLYTVTEQLSRPYYMNVATFAAAPVLDFGFGGALLALLGLGAAVGAIERRLRATPSMFARLALGLLVYNCLFTLYEGLVFVYVTPLVHAALLAVVLRRRSRSGGDSSTIGVRQGGLEARV